MDVMILAATERELHPVRLALADGHQQPGLSGIGYLATGVGLLHSTHAFTRALSFRRPALAIQVGIAGAFDSKAHPPGSAVVVYAEALGDTGVSEPDGTWRDVFDLGFGDPDQAPYTSKRLVNPHGALIASTGLPRVRGVTVNRVTSDAAEVDRLAAAYAPDVESMEGAALHYVCMTEGIPFVQLRGISNTVGDRDKSNWRIADAMKSLHEPLMRVLRALNETKRP